MYSIVKNVFLPRTIGSQWMSGDLTNTRLIDIFLSYSKAYVELSHPTLTNNIYVDLFIFREMSVDQTKTLGEILVVIGDDVLPTVPTLPNSTLRYAKYTDAVQSQFKIASCKKGFDIQDVPPYDRLTDLKLTRYKPATVISDIHDYCLTSVNGFIHMSDTDGLATYIDEGGKAIKKSRHNNVGLWSFADIGKLTKIKLDPLLIRPGLPDYGLKEKIYFDLSTDIGSKPFFLVLGGYLVFPKENVFWRRGDKSFALNLQTLPYVERVFESNDYIDLSYLQLTTDPVTPDVLNINELWGDDVIRRYLTMSQSFLVTVDVDNLDFRHLPVRCHNQSSQFTCYQDPSYPLLVGYGRTAEYWKRYEEGVWSMFVPDGYKHNYLINQLKTQNLDNINDHVHSTKPFYYSYANLLEIFGFNN